MRPCAVVGLLLAITTAARGDKLVLVAGGGDGGSAVKAKLTQPFGVDFGPDGRIYLVDRNGSIYLLDQS